MERKVDLVSLLVAVIGILPILIDGVRRLLRKFRSDPLGSLKKENCIYQLHSLRQDHRAHTSTGSFQSAIASSSLR